MTVAQRLRKLSYNPALTALVRTLGLRAVAQKMFYAATGKRPFLEVSIAGLSGRFRTSTALENRLVDATVTGETPLVEAMLSDLAPGDRMLDVGANLGFFTVFAARRCSSVFAIEPEPTAFERLSSNIALNLLSNVRTVNAALSDQTGRGFITRPESDRMIQDSHLAGSGHPIQLTRGDTLDYRPTVIKIDVEGHEIAVLDGLGERLQEVRLMLIEIHEGVSHAEVEARLRGFEIKRWSRSGQEHLVARRAHRA
jgi:FkbM family methyltransferase